MLQICYIKIYRALPKSKVPKLVALILATCAILLPYIFLTNYFPPPGQILTYIATLEDQSNTEKSSLSVNDGYSHKQPSLQNIPEAKKQSSAFWEFLHSLQYPQIPRQNPGVHKLPGSTRKPSSSVNHISQFADTAEKSFNGEHKDKHRQLQRDAVLEKSQSDSQSAIPEPPRLFGKDKTTEVRQIVFVKVHKAASSTMQNILLRFALARNLSVLLPRDPKRTSINEITSRIAPNNVIEHPMGQPFDILCNHVIYSKKEIAKYIPQSAVRIGILRTPLKQALSAVEYYTKYFPYAGIRKGLERYKDDPINGFLQHPELFYDWNTKLSVTYCFINNRMSMDLGFDTSQDFEQSKKNMTKINTFIKSLESDFDLMLISDYFEESLVLLRRYLKWTWKDIIYVKLNAANHSPNSVWAKRPVMNESAEKAFRAWNIIDIELYDYFFPLFLKKLKSEYLIHEEVISFRETLRRIHDFCLEDIVHDSFKVTKNLWTKEFSVTKEDCKLMSMKESSIVSLARKQQLERYKKYTKRIKS